MTGRLLPDSLTMFRRSLIHVVRYPSMTVLLIGQPVLILLLFVYVFGGAMGPGVAGGTRAAYLGYVVPGMLLFTVATLAMSTSISVAMDQTEGFIDRLRTMPIARPAILAGHVGTAFVQTYAALALMLAVAFALGYRSSAGPWQWLVLVALLGVAVAALTWLCVALGLAADSVETASNTPMLLMVLPFVSSSFVPTASMPDALRMVAEHQPFTPLNEATRGLLEGTWPTGHIVTSLLWCVGIGLLSFGWALRLFRGHAARRAR